ncbi:MAG: SPOR domain-containing protein [Hyphomicrobiaceae bacterium]|nr:SPOR domain-containing protein [Hyphomicrobiaceae bacterium]MCC0023617.1 SPOR domain-containing protein [Hyphomicrobiaceae bacterium]
MIPSSTGVERGAGGLFRLVALFVVAALLTISAQPARAEVPRAYAGIVVDAKTGNTLYSYAADSLRYPASVTKVMTLYILFQEIKSGRLSLSSPLRVSEHAAAAVPTKLYVRPGTTIKVEDAIKALVTLSANDVARVIAENISGTESKFAERMTLTAHALGMDRTTYVNASGLPDSRQVTTVRDQARLGMAMYQHFPDFYSYFKIRSFTYNGHTYGNHNQLLGQSGVDGMKTGYTRASGYNLLTSARANDRHIVVVGFGFSSGGSRNAKVLELVKKYIGQAHRGDYWRQAMIERPGSAVTTGNVFAIAQTDPVIPAPRPAFRQTTPEAEIAIAAQPLQITVAEVTPVPAPELPQANLQPVALLAPAPATRPEIENLPVMTASNEPPVDLMAPSPAAAPERSLDVIGNWINENFSAPSSEPGVLGYLPANGSRPVPPANIGGGQAIDLMTSGSINGQSASPVDGGWVVQVGAAPNQNAAEQLIDQAKTRLGALQDFRPYVERYENVGQVFYRARFSGFADRGQAVQICEQIKNSNMSCLAVQS